MRSTCSGLGLRCLEPGDAVPSIMLGYAGRKDLKALASCNHEGHPHGEGYRYRHGHRSDLSGFVIETTLKPESGFEQADCYLHGHVAAIANIVTTMKLSPASFGFFSIHRRMTLTS